MTKKEAEHVGRVTSEVRGRVLKIPLDNQAKRNSFSPEMMGELSNALETATLVIDLQER